MDQTQHAPFTITPIVAHGMLLQATVCMSTIWKCGCEEKERLLNRQSLYRLFHSYCLAAAVVACINLLKEYQRQH